MAANFPQMGIMALVQNLNGFLSGVGRMQTSTNKLQGGLNKTAVAGNTLGASSGKLGGTGVNSLSNMAMKMGALTGATFALKAVWDGLVVGTINYNKAILDSAKATGIGTEEMSRIVQVADDFGISQDTVTRSLQLATKNGFAPSIQNLAALADKVNAMEKPTERAAYLAKILGRNWATLDPLLQAGGDAIREMAEGIDDGLVVTKAEADATERLRFQIDELNDAWTGLTRNVGQAVIPKITVLLDLFTKLSELDPATWFQDGADAAAEFNLKFWAGTPLGNVLGMPKAIALTTEEQKKLNLALDDGSEASDEAAKELENYNKVLEASEAAAGKAEEANLNFFQSITKGTGGVFEDLGEFARQIGLGGAEQAALDKQVEQVIKSGKLSPEKAKELAQAYLPLGVFQDWAKEVGFSAGDKMTKAMKTELQEKLVEAGLSEKVSKAFVKSISADPEKFIFTTQEVLRTMLTDPFMAATQAQTDLFAGMRGSMDLINPAWQAFWVDPIIAAQVAADELMATLALASGAATAIGVTADILRPIVPTYPTRESREGVSPSTTNNMNLTIQSAAPVENIVSDFQMMRAMARIQ